METKQIQIKKIEENKGQIDGLPKNPRLIKDNRLNDLKKSIADAPEMLKLRELLVYPYNDKYIVIGGNMRLRACKELGFTEIPCKVIDKDTPVEKLREYTIKDNVGFGQDDWDALAIDWDCGELKDWGMEMPADFAISADECGEDFSLKEGDRDPFQQMTFSLADEQAEAIKMAIDDIKKTEEYKYVETFGNSNTNGNALYIIIKQWEDARR